MQRELQEAARINAACIIFDQVTSSACYRCIFMWKVTGAVMESLAWPAGPTLQQFCSMSRTPREQRQQSFTETVLALGMTATEPFMLRGKYQTNAADKLAIFVNVAASSSYLPHACASNQGL